eukprot:GFUD01007227.1.p1 GENE.GFUD01007227.1~~GFUD01007227.1.p1  ORF type:complete len:316 (-),score=94.54 GFUD01007227.1:19-966(-)
MAPLPSLPYSSIDLSDTQSWLSQLDTSGYTVIAGVSDNEQVLHARSLVWDWLECLGTGIERDKPATWQDEAWPDWPGIKKYGSCKSRGAAHLGATWYLRGLPRLKEVFTHIYKTEDLIVSLDGMILWRPWFEDESRMPGSSKLHVDQNPKRKPGFQCVQGMLPLYPVNAEVGGTVLIPKSHQLQADLMSRHPEWVSSPRDYCVVQSDDALQGQEMLVPLQPGDLLLWDSRLVHAGRVGDGGDVLGELARASLCVCMGPRERAAREVIARRRNAVVEGWCFSHWPWEAAGTRGKVASGRREKYKLPDLTEDQIKLL